MDDFKSLVKKGDEEYAAGNNELALSFYKRAVNLDHDCPEVWIKIGDSESWSQPIGKDTSIEIEKSYEDYVTAASLFEKTYYENGYEEILGGIMKQSNVLVGTILKCQNSKEAKYKIKEQVVACRILISWISKFFTTKKFEFESFQSEQFDFILQIMELIELNIKDYYTREPNGDFASDINGIKLAYKYELLPILLSLDCSENKKKAIIDEHNKKVELIKEKLENLKIQKNMLSEETNIGLDKVRLKIMEDERKDLRYFKDGDKKKELKDRMNNLAHKIDTTEARYQHELRHVVKKEKLLNTQVKWLDDRLNERLFFVEE